MLKVSYFFRMCRASMVLLQLTISSQYHLPISKYMYFLTCVSCVDIYSFEKMTKIVENEFTIQGSYMSAHVLFNLFNELEKK